jgi:hypothetical protein
VADITRQHFDRWFNKAYEPGQSTALLEKATAAALDDVNALVTR